MVHDPALASRRFQTELMLTFSRIHQQILSRSAQLMEAEGSDGITPASANALIVLFNARRPLNARELAQELAISEVTVSRFLRKMEDDGWIERTPDPSDGRAMLISPTRYARELFPRLVGVCNGVLDDIFGGLDPSSQHELAAMVQAVQDSLADAMQADAVQAAS